MSSLALKGTCTCVHKSTHRHRQTHTITNKVKLGEVRRLRSKQGSQAGSRDLASRSSSPVCHQPASASRGTVCPLWLCSQNNGRRALALGTSQAQLMLGQLLSYLASGPGQVPPVSSSVHSFTQRVVRGRLDGYTAEFVSSFLELPFLTLQKPPTAF